MSKLKLRRDTAVNWASADPVLAAGEPGLDLTNLVLKLGDGATHWSGLTGLDVRGNYVAQTQKGAASGVASLDGSSKVPVAQLPTGTSSTTVAIGNDSRITGALQKALVPTVLDAATYDANDAAQDALFASLPANAFVQIQAGTTIRRGSALTLTQPIHINGPGTFQDSRTSPTTAFINIPPAASGSTFYCPVKGSIVNTAVANHHGFNFQGTDNGAATPPTYVADVVIRLPELSGFGAMGVGGEFAQNATIDIDNFHNCAYAGVLILSATDVSARIRNAHDLLPGSSGLSYLVQFSRRSNTSDLVRYPNSKNCYGYVDVARNIPQWDGVGCHGMQGGYLGFGTMFGVKKPVDVVGSTGDDADALNAPNNIVVDLGHADSGVTDGSLGPAVTISGAIKATDALGSPTEYAKGIIIKPGVLRGYGVQGTTTSGAIYCLGTQGIVIDAGSIREPSPVAICMFRDNKDFLIQSVAAMDPWSTSGNAGIISIASLFNTGHIAIAKTSRGAKSATNVNNIGLRISADASNVITFGPGADFSSATQPINGTAKATAANAVVTAWTASTQIIAYVRYLLPTGGVGYSTTTRTTRASFDATEIAAWTFVPGGHYEKFTATTTRTVPLGITAVRHRLVGPGAGAGAGGSALTSGGTATQVGGASAGCGIEVVGELTGLIGGSSTLAYTHVAGANGGTGAAVNGNAGGQGTSAGTAQLDATTSAVVTTIKAAGGSRGNGGLGNSATTVNAGVMGHSTGNGVTANSYIPGAGGVASSTGGVGCAPSGGVCSGSAGGNATATLGGSGGLTQTVLGEPIASQQGHTGTANGGNGADGQFPGHGGAGGGGGAPGGTGGNGGKGADSVLELWY